MSIDQFAKHLKNLSNKSNTNFTFDFNTDITQKDGVEELDMDIILGEIEKAINSLKRGKSPGFDWIISDSFIDAKEVIVLYLLRAYNQIFNGAVYPESWAKCLIVRIHKNEIQRTRTTIKGSHSSALLQIYFP